MRQQRRLAIASHLAGLVLIASAGRAQEPTLYLTVAAGRADFELHTSGRTGIAAVRLDGTVRGPWLAEASLSVLRPREDLKEMYATYFAHHVRLVPEAMVQLQLLHGPVRPYVGAGAGLYIESFPTITGAVGAGVRIGLPPFRIGLQLDWRTRRLGFDGDAETEWTAGVRWRT